MKYENVAICDLRNIVSVEQAKQITLISHVAAVIFPEDAPPELHHEPAQGNGVFYREWVWPDFGGDSRERYPDDGQRESDSLRAFSGETAAAGGKRLRGPAREPSSASWYTDHSLQRDGRICRFLSQRENLFEYRG